MRGVHLVTIGGLLCIISPFTPMMWVPLLGQKNLLSMETDAAFISLALSAIALGLVAANAQRFALIPGIGNAIFAFLFFVNFLDIKRQAGEIAETGAELASLFGWLGDAFANSIALEWGWPLWAIGSMLLIIGSNIDWWEQKEAMAQAEYQSLPLEDVVLQPTVEAQLNKIGEIERLQRLRELNALTEEEFQIQKKVILGESTAKVDQIYPFSISEIEANEKNVEQDGYEDDEQFPEGQKPTYLRYLILVGFLLTAVIGAYAFWHANSDEAPVEAVVIGTANVRNAPTTQGSEILSTLETGDNVSGEWVEGSTDRSTRWLRLTSNDPVGYVWEGNLQFLAPQTASREGLPSSLTAGAPEGSWETISNSAVCLGLVTGDSFPVGNDGTQQEGCLPGIEQGSPSVCLEPRVQGEIVQPSQIWTNNHSGVRTICEHGGYCYSTDNIRLNAACSSTDDVGRFEVPDVQEGECPYFDENECLLEEEANRNR